MLVNTRLNEDEPMAEQAFFSLGEAAKVTGRSKSTLSNAIKTGRLSVHDRDGDRYRIAAAELFRVFPPNGGKNGADEHDRTPTSNSLNRALEREIELLREERERERGQLQAVVDDLRRRLDEAERERRDKDRQLTALLTDQRAKGEASKRPWWRRVFAGRSAV